VKKIKKDHKGPTERVVKLKNLPPGTPFIFHASRSKAFRNMMLTYSGDARCVVEGFKNDGKKEGSDEDSWSFFKDNCAPDAEVVVDKSRTFLNIVQDEMGSHRVKNNKEVDKDNKKNKNRKNKIMNDTNVDTVVKVNDSHVNKESVVKSKRGRKPGAPKIAFPASREFTAPELVEEFGLQTYVVSNELNKALREGRIVKVGATPSNKGRGRHCKVFKVANN
jgi:hypothetical protein